MIKLFKRRLSFSGEKQKQTSSNSAEDAFEQEDKARFSDTSWQIHRSWSRNGNPLPLSPPPNRAAAGAGASASSATPPSRNDENGIYDTITGSVRIIEHCVWSSGSTMCAFKDWCASSGRVAQCGAHAWQAWTLHVP
ncbi:hypothetical protein RR48_09137 [Papilio machaon]|uniref:Uncharacterized protein n=1 Tax=Papilio machaon TaxID=76193 RepID=A0A194RCW3_PAPMA|nr:hypothetical protein RR48_09137 [Papilio machaon]